MNLSRFSVNRPVAIIMVVLAVVILGAVSLGELNLDLYPELNLPVALVMTSYPGAGPQEVESMVTKPLEETLGTVNGVKEIQSMSMVGSSVVVVEFNWGTDMDFATLKMREKVDFAKSFLPDDAEAPVVIKMDPALMPVLQLGVTGELSPQEMRSLADDTIKSRLERVDGVASVWITGGLTREIQVLLSPEKLAAHDVSLQQVIQALQAQNMNLSGGQVVKGQTDYLVRVTGEFKSLRELEEVSIITPDGASVRLAEVARVVDGFRDVTQMDRMNGRPSIGLNIQKQTSANTVQVVRNVRKALADLKDQLPGNIQVATLFDQAEYIEQSISNLVQNIILGGLLATFILFVFLRDFRSTLVIAISMPFSIIATFTMVYFGGLNLNMMTLGGLALGVGMMVDNSIVILENIFRHRQEGMGSLEAAVFGANEVTGAITASTLTTVAVFLPIVFVQGMASQLFRPLALTVTFSLLASLVVALTLLPMLASRMLRVPPLEDGEGPAGKKGGWRARLFAASGRWLLKLNEAYRRLLTWSLGHRWQVIGLTTLAFVASMALVPLVGVEFIPGMDMGQVSVNIEMPHGTTLAETNRVAAQVENVLEEIPEREAVFTSVGSATGNMGGLSIGQPENARIDLLLKDGPRRSSEQVADYIRQRVAGIPGARIKVSAVDATANMGLFTAPVQVILRGDDLDVLKNLAETVAEQVRQVPGTREVETSLQQGRPEVQVIVDKDRAARYGLTAAQVASATRAAIQGQVASRYRTGGEEIDIRVRLEEDARQDLQDLQDLRLATPLGGQVRLGDIADLAIAQGPSTIERKDQARMVSVNSQISGRDLGSVTADIRARLAGLRLPPGYTLEYSGQAKEMGEAFGDLTLAMVLAVVLVYMVMAAQFESLVHPFTIMFSLPAAAIGVTVSLGLTGRSFGVTAFIGIIILAGIVVNNAIVLVDYVNILRGRGMERDAAIVKAGPTRLRPILMTALTTVLGLLPVALGVGEGAEAQAPMATVVMGGLLFSTLITLVLVPVVYSLFDDAGKWFGRRRAARQTKPMGVNG